MLSITIEISESLKERLELAVASGDYPDRNAAVQHLLEFALNRKWRDEVESKLDESIEEFERGEFEPWKEGDFVRFGQQYMAEKRAEKKQ